MKIVILDYGMGNISSVYRKLSRLNCQVIASNIAADIMNADKIILPGVGHFGKAMRNLEHLSLLSTLNELVLIKKKPILGICLGMQLMAKHSEEGDIDGLGWIDAEVVRFKIKNNELKIPHMGWNQIEIANISSRLMKDIENQSEFYFVHSYHFKCNNVKDILNFTDYSYKFASAIEKDNIFGVQYHPEKSHSIGIKLLENFINL